MLRQIFLRHRQKTQMPQEYAVEWLHTIMQQFKSRKNLFQKHGTKNDEWSYLGNVEALAKDILYRWPTWYHCVYQNNTSNVGEQKLFGGLNEICSCHNAKLTVDWTCTDSKADFIQVHSLQGVGTLEPNWLVVQCTNCAVLNVVAGGSKDVQMQWKSKVPVDHVDISCT